MKLEIVSSQVSFVGKMREEKKIASALTLMANSMGEDSPAFFDNSDEDCDYCDVGFAYDMSDWKAEDIKWQWRKIKKGL